MIKFFLCSFSQYNSENLIRTLKEFRKQQKKSAISDEMHLWMTSKQTVKKLNLWDKMAVDKSAWIKSLYYRNAEEFCQKKLHGNLET